VEHGLEMRRPRCGSGGTNCLAQRTIVGSLSCRGQIVVVCGYLKIVKGIFICGGNLIGFVVEEFVKFRFCPCALMATVGIRNHNHWWLPISFSFFSLLYSRPSLIHNTLLSLLGHQWFYRFASDM
jgi:hypothetical protein